MGTEEELRQERLLSKAKQGDRSAADQLIEPCRDMLVGYFMKRLNDRERAEDLAQDAITAGYLGLSRFSGNGPYSAYLVGIANHLLKRYLARDPVKQGKLSHVDTEITLELLSEAREPGRLSATEQQVTNAELVEALRRQMHQCCTDDERRVIDLIYQGESEADIADILDKDKSTVRTLFLRGRRKLLAHLVVHAPELLGGEQSIQQAWTVALSTPDPKERVTSDEKGAWEIGPVHGKIELFRSACLKMARYLPAPLSVFVTLFLRVMCCQYDGC